MVEAVARGGGTPMILMTRTMSFSRFDDGSSSYVPGLGSRLNFDFESALMIR